MRRVLIWVAWFLVLNLVWLWLISAFNLQETILGLFASALGATAALAVHVQNLITFRPRLSWLLPAVLLPLRGFRETGMVLAALWGQLTGRGDARGRFRTERVSLPDDPAESAAKRALMIAGESFAPNAYVLGIKEESGLMLVHELVDEERE
jgi:hypothetical protein